MKVDAHDIPPLMGRAGRPWSFVLSLIDGAVVMATYLAILLLGRQEIAKGEFILLVASVFLLYPGRTPFARFSPQMALNMLATWVGVGALLIVVRVVRATFDSPRQDVFDLDASVLWVIAAPAALFCVHALSPFLAPHLRRLYRPSKVIVVGVNDSTARLAQAVARGDAEGAEGQRLLACFDDRRVARSAQAAMLPVAGDIADASDYAKQHKVDIVYISLPMSPHPRLLALLAHLRDTTASIRFVPDIFVTDVIQGCVDAVAGVPVVSVCETPLRGPGGPAKRALDLSLTIAALPLLIPLLAVIALLVLLTSPGAVIFKQRRYGLDGKEFLVWKFRTMYTSEDGDSTYRQVTRGDDRVTPLGRVLRKTSLDELPQLLNVLAGSMSLVGPRPHALAVNEQYRKLIPGYMVRHKVKPGITGWAQVNGYRGGDDLLSMQKRTEYDLAYLRTWSLLLDLRIILLTASLLILGDKRAF